MASTTHRKVSKDKQAQAPANRRMPKHQDALANEKIPSAGPRQADEPGPLEPAEPLDSRPAAQSPHVEGYAPTGNPDNPEFGDSPGITELPEDATSEDIDELRGRNQGPERVNQQIV